MENRDVKKLLRRLPFLLLIPLGLLIPRLFSGRATWLETHYCDTVYPAIRQAIAALTAWAPFSIAELLLYAVIAFAGLFVVVQAVRLLLKKLPIVRFCSQIILFGVIFGIGLNLFYTTWGLNYFREPLSARMELPVRARSHEELALLYETVAEEAARVRELVREDANGVFAADIDACFAALPEAYKALSEDYPVFSGDLTRPKHVLWSKGLSKLGIAGIYIGLTAEPNVNTHQTPLLVPHAGAHEMAHQLGLASENEAEFAAFLACMYADDPAVRYSGLMLAVILAGNALHDADAELYAAVQTKTYTAGMVRDLIAYREYWDAFEGKAQEIATSTNDSYLKHNAQQSGVKSYGEAVDLLLAFQEKIGFFDLFSKKAAKST